MKPLALLAAALLLAAVYRARRRPRVLYVCRPSAILQPRPVSGAELCCMGRHGFSVN